MAEHDHDLISDEEARQIASGWGSFISSGDPGAIFYTFPLEGRPDWSAADRDAALDHLDACVRTEEARRARGPDYGPQDLVDLEALRAWIVAVYGERGAELPLAELSLA